jgi:hypothetical protein
MCEEEKELPPKLAQERVDFSKEQRVIRPRSRYWKDVYFCDEFHFGIGPQITKRIKRKMGRKYKYKPQNVHRKKTTAKDTKAKAREPEYLKLLNVFVVIGFNYRKMIPYDCGNSNRKMKTEVYLKILEELLPDLEGITLCQDKDSAHNSAAVEA